MKVLVCVFFILPVALSGQQVLIDFENDELTEWIQSDSKHWCISDVVPIYGNYSLWHCFDSEIAASDWIAFFHQPVAVNDTRCRWDFNIRYGHEPSANNNWAVFLGYNCMPADNGTISNGLVMGVNYTGNSDEIMVWEIIDSNIDCLLNTEFNWQLTIKPEDVVEFSIEGSNGSYRLFMAVNDENPVNLGSFSPENSQFINSFILFYKYSASYDRELWFDDLTIEAGFMEDTQSPSVEYYSFIDPKTIEIGFSEPVRIDEHSDWCIDGIGCSTTPSNLTSIIELGFANAMVPGYSYILNMPQVQDMYGNSIHADSTSLELYYTDAYDVVISEIMADPVPAVLLPEAEYVELFNTSDKSICLKNWKFTSNTRQVILPDMNLTTGSYILLCDRNNESLFEQDLNILGLTGFPVLANSEASLILQDRSGKLIHAVNYNDEWYSSTDKKEGGWSLEMVNPWDPCSGSDNWSESQDYRGGSPAGANSVYFRKTINPEPELWRAAVTDTGSLMLYFSEPLDSNTVNSYLYYSVNKNIGLPQQVLPSWPLADRVELFFTNKFNPGEEYSVSLTSDLCDCSGIRITQPARLGFSVPEEADSSDIIFNEILFDPGPEQIEFIELYNPSDKTIDLKEFEIIIHDRSDSGKIITTDHWPLQPGEFCLIASDFRGIDFPGKFDRPDKLVYMPSMPRLPNAGDVIYLQSKTGHIIDAACYSPDWHHEILEDTKGVSLERISPFGSGVERSGWHSASYDAGYMTPAAQNSQGSKEEVTCIVTLIPETITPNSDGIDEELSICYQLDEEGYMGRIIVFDINGKKCSMLANGTLLGVSGCYTFNGRNEKGHILPTGYYILFFEAYHENGKKYAFKKAFVIAP